MDCITYARILFNANPDITAEEMLHNLHCANYSFSDCVAAVKVFFSLAVDALCQLAVNEFKHPRVEKDMLRSAFIAIGYPDAETDAAIAAHYPSDTSRYALCLSSDSVVTAPSSAAYNLGTGDFTVEAWIKPASGGGTILSRKPTEGCCGNGGFLLVLKSTGVIKLATDDGYGFYEINTDAVSNIFDGNYHHVLGLRKNCGLEIYVDFQKVSATPRTDRFSELNINNSLRLAAGFTDQVQEPYNHYSGSIGEIRMWSKAKTYTDKDDWKSTDYVSWGLIGLWAFDQKSGSDYSNVSNNMTFENASFEAWEMTD